MIRQVKTPARDTIVRRDPLTGMLVREAPFFQWPELDGLGHNGLTCGSEI